MLLTRVFALMLLYNFVTPSPERDLNRTIMLQALYDGQHLEESLMGRELVPRFSFHSKAQLVDFVQRVAKKSHLDPKLVLNILRVESQFCKFKVSRDGRDIGCSQINVLTAKAYHFNVENMRRNEMVDVYAGIVVLLGFKRAFGRREPDTWFSRYNTGWLNLPEARQAYITRLESAPE